MRNWGYDSLFQYLVQGQKYSEGAAQRRISAARLLKDLPEIENKIQEGALNLTQLAKLAVAVKQEQKHTGQKVSLEEKKELIEKLENKNGFETEKLLSQEFDFTPTPKEKTVPRKDEVYLTLKLSKDQFEKLKQAQMILSHQVHDGNYAETLEVLCDKVIQGRQKTRKASSVEKAFESEESQNPPSTFASTAATAVGETSLQSKNKRIYLSKALRVEVYQKANHCCEYVCATTGKRCSSQYQSQIDHIIPLARGGINDLGNLRVPCQTHNLAQARRWRISRD